MEWLCLEGVLNLDLKDLRVQPYQKMPKAQSICKANLGPEEIGLHNDPHFVILLRRDGLRLKWLGLRWLGKICIFAGIQVMCVKNWGTELDTCFILKNEKLRLNFVCACLLFPASIVKNHNSGWVTAAVIIWVIQVKGEADSRLDSGLSAMAPTHPCSFLAQGSSFRHQTRAVSLVQDFWGDLTALITCWEYFCLFCQACLPCAVLLHSVQLRAGCDGCKLILLLVCF